MSSEEDVRAAKMQVAGQKIVDVLGENLTEIEDVLTTLASITGHYLAGIADEETRDEYYQKVGRLTRHYTDDNLRTGDHATITTGQTQ